MVPRIEDTVALLPRRQAKEAPPATGSRPLQILAPGAAGAEEEGLLGVTAAGSSSSTGEDSTGSWSSTVTSASLQGPTFHSPSGGASQGGGSLSFGIGSGILKKGQSNQRKAAKKGVPRKRVSFNPGKDEFAKYDCSTTASDSCEDSSGDDEVPSPGVEKVRLIRPSRSALRAPIATAEWNGSDFEQVRRLHQRTARSGGSVELMRRLADGRFMAVKRLPMPASAARNNSRCAADLIWHDAAMLRFLNSQQFPHACSLEGVFRDEQHLLVATSFADQGDLLQWCDHVRVHQEARMRPIVQQIAWAVQWLHDRGISHRHLSMESIVLQTPPGGSPDDVPQVKIIDFTTAKVMRRYTTGCFGKRPYVAPEMHSMRACDTFLSDIFALGVIFFTMAAHEYPWQATKEGACKLFDFAAEQGLRKAMSLRATSSGVRFSELMSEDLVSMLESLLTIQPRCRATLGERCFQGQQRADVWSQPWLTSPVQT